MWKLLLSLLPIAIFACSWDKPIWTKNRLSDTPLFRYNVDGKTGYINGNGRVVVPPKYKVFGNHGYDDFFEGVGVMDSFQGEVLDSHGQKVRFPFTLSQFNHFSEGVIAVGFKTGDTWKVGYSDHSGKLVIPAIFDGAGAFSEGLAVAGQSQKVGFIDHTGKFVVEPYLLSAEPFREGAARVILNGPCNYSPEGPCGFANPSILGYSKYTAGFDRDLPNCQYSFIDKRGVTLFSQVFPVAQDFSEGYAAVGDGKQMGFINKAGVLRISLKFDFVRSFSEGLAAFLQDSKWGYINQRGEIVIAAKFESADLFSAGAAVVSDGSGRVYFIDKSGQKLFGKDFAVASGFHLGLAHVAEKANPDNRTYVDRAGKVVFAYRTRTTQP